MTLRPTCPEEFPFGAAALLDSGGSGCLGFLKGPIRDPINPIRGLGFEKGLIRDPINPMRGVRVFGFGV